MSDHSLNQVQTLQRERWGGERKQVGGRDKEDGGREKQRETTLSLFNSMICYQPSEQNISVYQQNKG